VLSMTPEGRANVATFIFYDSSLGQVTGRKYVEVDVFRRFYNNVVSGYIQSQPYHNAAHAVDVLHAVYRTLELNSCHGWISGIEMFALLIAALGHDIGHPGKTNPFLVETRHEFAVTYNDASPLENMHCASLFRLGNKPGAKIFGQFDAADFKKARKLCIAAILHTDASLHFDMVKEIKKLYEINLEVCDNQAKDWSQLNADYEEMVLKENVPLFENLFLHFCDISNPMKPWAICKAWAERVLDEFFDQGDKEKALAIPVGMLNDRDKVNRPGSQHGFINFMVAPIVFETVRIFQPLDLLMKHMASNLAEWRNEWVKDAKPDADAIAKRDDDVKNVEMTTSAILMRAAQRGMGTECV